MKDINRMTVMGNLGQDPEIRHFDNGRKVCNLSVATNVSWKDKNTGDWNTRTEWHKVVIWNQHLINRASKYLHKGSRVYLEGEVQTRQYNDKEGTTRYITEIVLNFEPAILIPLDRGNPESQPQDDIEFQRPSTGSTTNTTHDDIDPDDDIPW